MSLTLAVILDKRQALMIQVCDGIYERREALASSAGLLHSGSLKDTVLPQRPRKMA